MDYKKVGINQENSNLCKELMDVAKAITKNPGYHLQERSYLELFNKKVNSIINEYCINKFSTFESKQTMKYICDFICSFFKLQSNVDILTEDILIYPIKAIEYLLTAGEKEVYKHILKNLFINLLELVNTNKREEDNIKRIYLYHSTTILSELSWLLNYYFETKIENERLLTYLNIVKKSYRSLYKLECIHLYSISNDEIKEEIISEIFSRSEVMSSTEIYYVISEGILSYNQSIENNLIFLCNETSFDNSNHRSLKNPFYVITKLYFWGYIINLAAFQIFVEKSNLLSLIINPKQFIYEKFQTDWFFVLQSKQYLSYAAFYGKEVIVNLIKAEYRRTESILTEVLLKELQKI